MATSDVTPVGILRGVAVTLRQEAATQDRNQAEVFSVAATAVEELIAQLTRTRAVQFVERTSFFVGGFAVGVYCGLGLR